MSNIQEIQFDGSYNMPQAYFNQFNWYDRPVACCMIITNACAIISILGLICRTQRKKSFCTKFILASTIATINTAIITYNIALFCHFTTHNKRINSIFFLFNAFIGLIALNIFTGKTTERKQKFQKIITYAKQINLLKDQTPLNSNKIKKLYKKIITTLEIFKNTPLPHPITMTSITNVTKIKKITKTTNPQLLTKYCNALLGQQNKNPNCLDKSL